MRRFSTGVAVAAAAAALVLGGAAAPAAAATTGPPPADCTVTVPGSRTATLTCTDRPAGSQWAVRVVCVSSRGLADVAVGGTVTGNGASTGTCRSGVAYPENVYFVGY